MKRILPILLLGLLLLNLTPSGAQTLQPDYGAPTVPVNVCNGNAVFKVKVVGGVNACTQGILNLHLPAGYVYATGSASLSAGTGSVTETSFSGNTAVLTVQSIPAAPGFTEISYQAYATCAALAAGTSVNNQVNYTFNSACVPSTTVTSNSFNTQSASLTITNITNASYFGAAGDNYTRTITITNNGWGSVSRVNLTDTSGSGLYIKGISASGGWTFITNKTIVGADTVTTFTLSGAELTQGQSITLIENVTMVSSCNLQTRFATWFGCDNTPCTSNNVSGTATAGATVNNSYLPSLKVIPDLQPLVCRGTDYVQTIRLTNAGSVRLNDLSLNLFASSSLLPAALQSFNAATPSAAQAAFAGFQIRFGQNGVWTSLTPVSSGNFSSPASCLGSGNSNVFFRIPVINPGDTVFITYNEKNCPVPAAVNNTLFTAGTLLRYDYEAPCGGRTTAVSALLRNPVTTQLTPQAALPASMIPGQPYNFTYHFPAAQSGLYTNTGANASSIRFDLVLPSNIDFSGNASDISLKHPVTGATIASPSSFIYNAGTHTVTLTFAVTPGFTVASLQNAVLSFTNLTLDCAAPSSGNTVTLNGHLKSTAACAAEEWLFSEVTTVSFACPQPPCDVNGGMEFSGFSIQRTNFGFADNDNNGIADASGMPDLSKVRSDLAMPGDTVVAVFNGRFVTGSASPSFQYAYAVDTFSAGAGYLTSLYARVEIYLFGSNTPFYICNNVPVQGGSGATRKVDVSLSTLNDILPLPPGYYEFFDGDSIAVHVYYKVTGNPGSSFLPVQVKNSFYLSDVPDPSSPAQQYTCGNNMQGSFNLVGYQAGTSGTQTYSSVGNGNIATSLDYFLSLGGTAAGSKPFVNEYRPISIQDEARYTVPANYDYVSATVSYTYTTGVGVTTTKTVAISPVNAAASPLVFNIAGLFQNGTFPAGDQGNSLTLTVTIKPGCEAVPRSEALFYMSQVATPGFTTGFANASINDNDSIYLTAPAIIASTANTTPTSNDANVTWEIQISNPTIATASRVWMGKESGAGVTITSIQRLSGPGGFVMSTLTATGGGIYQLGSLGQSSNYYRINATYTSCIKDSMQMAYWYDCAGLGYPSNVAAAVFKKEIKLSVIPLQPALQNLIVSEPASTPAHDFCDVLTYEIETINTGSSNVKDLTVTAYLPGSGGVVYVPGTFQFQYPAGSGTYIAVPDAQVSTGSNSVTFTIPASEITELLSTESFRIKFGLQTSCGFGSGESFRFTSTGSSFCGKIATATQQQGQKIAINGIPQYTNLYSISSTTTTGLLDCTTGEIVATYKFKIINQGPLPTTVADGFRIALPSPWQLNTGSIVFTRDPGGASYKGFSGGNYNFLMGIGVPAGDSVVFTATVRVPAAAAATYPTGTSAAATEQAVIRYGGVCSQTGIACPVTELVVATQNTTTFNYAGGQTGLPVLVITNPAPVCSPSTVDITQAGITAGSTAGLTYTFFTNAAGTTVLANPSAISISGTYYIKGTSVGGCTDLKPVTVVINPLPIAGIAYTGSPFCTVGNAAVTQTGQAGGTYSSTTGLILNPSTGAINLSGSTPGTYLVTYSFSNGTCNNTASTTVVVAPPPALVITNPSPVCAPATIDLTQPAITAGSSSGLTLSYFTNAAATTALTNPSAVSASGTYYIMATSGAGCKTIQPVTVVVNAQPSAAISYAGPYCTIGTANVTQTGQGGGTYSSAAGLIINPSTGAVNLATSTPGTYTVTYSFTNGICSNTATATITISTAPNLVINNPASVCAPATVNITAAAITAGSDAGLTFAYFTNAAATNVLTNPAAIAASGTYYIQATSAAGCKTVQPVTVTINPLPVAAISYPNSPYCSPGAATAVVTQTGQAGGTYSAPAGLSINATTGAVNLTASTPGTYTVTYTFSNGVCSNTATASIVIGATLTLNITNPPAVCAPATVNLTAAGIASGTPGLTYNYYTDATGTTPLSNPSAIASSGTYYIQGVSAGGCTTPVRPVTVVINPAPVAAIVYNGAPFCGTATISVTQTGQGGGTYSAAAGLSINPSTGAINLGSSTPGTYTVTYTFSNGTCSNSTTTSIVIITSPALITHDPVPACAPASVDLTAAAVTAGSTPGLSFTYFTNAAGTNVLANPNAITTGGTYYIQGTSGSGCTTTIVPVTVTINPPPAASISYAGSPYCQAITSSASVIQTGQGGGTYSSTTGLSINPATGVINITGSAPGTYTVTYTFSNGICSNTATTLVTIVSSPVLLTNDPAPVCAPTGVDLTAAAVTAGSTAGLTFNYFSNASGTNILANPNAITTSGTYYIQGTSPAGCKTTIEPVVVVINPLPVAAISYPGSPFCAAGKAAVLQTGQGGGTYSGAAGLDLDPGSGEIDLSSSTPGTYTITYTFSNGSCTSTATASITISVPPVLVITTPVPVCAPATVNITAAFITTGSTPGMTYAYFSDAAATTPLTNANAISSSGTYFIQGTSAGGCKVIGAVQVTINPAPVASISYAGSPFCTAGAGIVTQTGQTGGTYTAAAGLSINPATGQINVAASTPGNYTVTYNFSNGICNNTATTNVVIGIVPNLVVTSPAPVCAPATVDLTASVITAGSTAGLTYNYYTDAAGTNILTNPNAVPVGGTYYIQAATPAGCKSIIRPVTVVINSPLVASIAYNGSPYCAAQTASASVTQSGQGGGTYSSTPGLSINPATGAINIITSMPGTYTVTYSFTNGTCTNAATATLTINPLPVLIITNPAAVCAPGMVDITAPTVTAGSTPGLTYSYYLDPGGLLTLPKPEAIGASGTYYIQGVAPSGCVTGIEAVTVTVNLLPVASIAYNSAPFCLNAGGTGVVTQTGFGGGTYSSTPAGLAINASTGAIDISASSAGTYTVTYSFNNGLCSNTTKTTVSILPQPVLMVNDPAPACIPATVNITTAAVTAGSTPGLTYQYFSDAACTSPLANPAAISTSGTYYIRGAYASSGCITDVKSVLVIINANPSITVAGSALVCKGEAVTITASSPGNTVTWQNMSGNNSVIVYPQTTTTYTAVATNAAGCTATGSVQVQVRDFEVTLTANSNPIMPGTTLTLTSGANSSFNVIGWKPESVFQAQTALAQSFLIKDSSQTFAVIGRSADGCLDTATLRVELEPGDKDFFIPNAFTPNNDGKNDVFKLYGSSIKSVELRVFNQWGELVYETKDKTKGWDGTFKGRPQPVGVYPFGVKVTFLDNTVITRRGTVNLVR